MALRAPPGPIVLNGPHLAPPAQDAGPHFGSAMPHPSSSDAAGAPVLSRVSVLPLARLGPQLVAPPKRQGLLVALLLALPLPAMLVLEVLMAPCFPGPREQLVSAHFGIHNVSYIK